MGEEVYSGIQLEQMGGAPNDPKLATTNAATLENSRRQAGTQMMFVMVQETASWTHPVAALDLDALLVVPDVSCCW